MNAEAKLTQERRSWRQGAVDAFKGEPPRADVVDPLAYASGRVEGQAWREQGRDLDKMLRLNRLPTLVREGDQGRAGAGRG